jgi:hypothetical protein
MRWLLYLLALAAGCSDPPAARRGAPSARLRIGAPAVAGTPTVADASDSSDPEGKLLRYRFEFGDGSNAVITGAARTLHVFAKAGQYRPCVTVIDPEGLIDVACASVSVDPERRDSGVRDAGTDTARADARLDAPDRGADAPPPDTGSVDHTASDKSKDKSPLDKGKPPDQAKPDKPGDKSLPDKGKPPDQAQPDKPGDKSPPDKPGDTAAKPDAAPCFSPELGGTGAAGYTLKQVPACSYSAAGSSKLGINKDDTAAVTLLPFPFTFFGKTSIAAGVSSNGYLQFVGASPLTLLASAPAAIPSAADPNHIIAAFWDNLAPLSSTSDVWVGTVGSAPKRVHVIQWQGWRFSGVTSPATELVFSIFLYEGSNVVELQYAKLVGDSRANGSMASFGIENESGTQGVQHAYKKPDAVSTTSGIRFVPK